MAKLSLIVDSSQAERALWSFVRTTEGVTMATDRTAGAFDRMIKRLVALGLAYKTYDFARDALRQADTAAREAGKFNRIFGDLAAGAQQWAASVSESLRVQETDVQRAASKFQIMFENMGLGARTAAEMSLGLTELGAKLAIVNRVSAEEALGTLESGLMGNNRALRELGITLNDMLLEQYALEKGWISQGQQLNQTGRAYTTYRLVLEQTAKATEGVANADQHYSEQQRQLNTNLAETKEIIGTALKPAVTEALTAINKALWASQGLVKRWAQDFKEGAHMVGAAWQSLQDQNQADLAAQWSRLTPNMQRAVSRAYESQRSEPAGYKTTVAPGLMGGGAAVPTWQRVSDPAYLRRLIESYEHAWYGTESPERATTRQAARPQPITVEPAVVSGQATTPSPTTNAPGPGGVPGEALFYDTQAAQAVLRDLELQKKLLYASNVERQKALALEQAQVDKASALGKEIERAVEALEDYRQNFFGGFTAGLLDLKDEIGSLGELGERLGKGLREGVVGALGDAIFEARDLGEAFSAMGRDLARMMYEWAMNKAIVGTLTAALGGGPAAARGLVIAGGQIVPMATGNIVDRPAYFPLAQGRTGLMGEAGPEAIMPLARTPSGHLGVRTQGTGADANAIGAAVAAALQKTPIALRITNVGPESAQDYLDTRDGEKHIVNIMRRNRKAVT